jgi:hypothetical protein
VAEAPSDPVVLVRNRPRAATALSVAHHDRRQDYWIELSAFHDDIATPPAKLMNQE